MSLTVLVADDSRLIPAIHVSVYFPASTDAISGQDEETKIGEATVTRDLDPREPPPNAPEVPEEQETAASPAQRLTATVNSVKRWVFAHKVTHRTFGEQLRLAC